MIRYLLDTNICIYLIKKKPANLIAHLKQVIEKGLGISSITLSELEYGVQKSAHLQRNKLNLLRFLAPFDILPYDEKAAGEYGKIRVNLERKGKIIGNMDLMIGAHAKSLQTILVTNNEREFSRIEGLRIENWVKLNEKH